MNNYIPPRLVSRSVRFVVISWWLLGFLLIIAPVLHVDVNPAITEGVWAEIILGLLLLLGSSLIQLSVIPTKREDRAWALELVGWPVLTGAWLLYTSYTWASGPWWFPITVGVSFIIATAYRFSEVVYLARRTRKNVAQLKESDVSLNE